MLKHNSGSIINLASIGGVVGVRDRVAYCATKFAVVGLTRSMALDQLHLQQRQRQDAAHARQENQMRFEQSAGAPPGGSGANDLPRLARERDMEAARARRERDEAERSWRDP